MLAGFEEPDAGRVLLGGEELAGTPPHRRPVRALSRRIAVRT
jgi:ABC-type Fe3+/spermidine/putrescine transport system ATPase subunit